MTIRTVTFNPGFDHNVVVDGIGPGLVGSILSWRTLAGGKGLNVSRAVSAMGGTSVAYALVGATDGEGFKRLAILEGYSLVCVTVEGASMRHNLTLRVGQAGEAPAGHAVGPRFSDVPAELLEELLNLLASDIEPGDLVSFNGSLPDGSVPQAWVDAAEIVASRGALLVADVQGLALPRLLETGYVLAAKPNEDEAREFIGTKNDLTTFESAILAVRRMHELGVVDPVVTLGRQGAIHLREDVIVHSTCRSDSPQVEVGAGDVFVAGYCVVVTGQRWTEFEPVDVGLAAASAHVDGFEGGELAAQTESRIGRVVTREVIQR